MKCNAAGSDSHETAASGTRMHVYGYDKIYQVTDVNYPEDFDYLATDTAFSYDAGNMTYDGKYEYGAACPEPAERDAENRLIQVHNTTSLSAACDTPAPFTTGGDAE